MPRGARRAAETSPLPRGRGSGARSLLVASAAAAALAGCAPRVPPPDLSLEPGPLLAQVEEAAARVKRVSGEARIRVSGPGGRGTLPAFVAAEKPDRLRVEALGFFGNPLAVLVASGGRLSIYDARERTFYRGAATPENLALLVPLPLSPAELVALLCGSPPLVGEAASARAGRGHVELVLEAGARRQRVRVGSGAAVERSEVTGDAGVPDREVRFADVRILEGVRFPMEIAVRSSDGEAQVELAWTDVAPNAPLDPGLFRLDPPAGARVVDLDQGVPVHLPPPLLPEGSAAAP